MKKMTRPMKTARSAGVLVLCLLLLLGSFSALASEQEPSEEPSSEPEEGILSLWTEDAVAREELVSYMEAVTGEGGADYIPVENRVAVFDLDGTLFCETDPNYFDYCLLKYRVLDDPEYKDQASDFEREVALKIQEQNETGASFEGLEVDHGKAVASAFAGMTVEEFNDYIQEFKKQPMPSYAGMNRGDGWYQPMLQVVDYLQANDFTVYIVSGTDRFIVRGIADGSPLDLPPWQIIGSDETLVASNQGDTDGLDYVFADDDALVLGGEFVVKNLKMNKVTVIAQEIGVQPVLSFGNSTGDASMAEYVTSGNPYRSLAFMLCCDDTERENGSMEKANKMFDLCGAYGWVPVSMKNDWTTIYGDGVTYLGAPHPTEATDPAEILAGMSVEQKLAQMTMVAFGGLDEAVEKCLTETQPGGILLFAGNCPNAASTAALTAQLQRLAIDTSGIPLLISTDQEGGYIVRLTESTWFPGNMALAATGDTENAFLAASVMGEELLACGVNVDFGPVLDVNSNPANPIIGVRSFGEDPETVAAFGEAYVNGLHEAGEIAALKHFPGHGDTDTDSHTGLPSVDKSLKELREFELVSFQAAIDAGADMVMTAHIVYPQVETNTVVSSADGEEIYLPATLSHTILTELLRDEMGFQGVVVTDSLIMDAIAENFGLAEAAAMAINAGADILLDPVRIQTEEDCETYIQFIRDLTAMVEEGTISEERLDESVLRILALKDKYGILDRSQYETDPEAAIKNAQTAVSSEEHKAAEREITEQAITLVKNDEGLIPYTARAGERIVVLTAWDSEAPAAEYGMQTAVDAGAIPAGAEIVVASYDERRIGDISDTIDGAALCVILTRMSSEAYLDPTSATGAAGTLADIVIDRVHEQGGKVIVVSVQLPYDTARYPEADAIVAAYNPTGSRKLAVEGTEEAIYNYAPNIPTALRMIFDGTPMTGRLPVSVPALTADYAFADEILYPAGFCALEESYPEVGCGIYEINSYGNVILDIYASELDKNGYEAGDIVSVTIGDETWQMPYGTGYSDVDPGYMLLLSKNDSLILAVNQKSFADEAGLTEKTEGVEITIRMEEKGGYLRQYEARNMAYSDDRADYDSDEAFANFRNIAMGDIAEGVLYRSASGINDEHGRAAFVNALCEENEINAVIDLGLSPEEIEEAAETEKDSYYIRLYEDSRVVANGSLGIDMTSDSFKQRLADDLRGMLSQKAPYVLPCTEGKDRTGAVALILEALMGASYDEMLDDYITSYVNYYHLEKGDVRYQTIADGNATYLFMTLSGTEHASDMERADYQAAAEQYLLGAGLSADELAQLKGYLSGKS